MSQPVDPSRAASSAGSASSASSDQAPERRIYTITQLLAGLRRLLEDRVGSLWIVGEISNLHNARSGHSYFSLKDGTGQLRAVLFRASAQRLRFDLEEGLEVLVYAEVSVYEARGDLQLIVREVEPRGQGALQLAIEQLRARLDADGLFDPARKRPLPEHPRAIAVVTSPTSAAVRDVIHVAGLRLPGIPLYVVPTRVQGEGADREIAAALDAIAAISGRAPRELPVGSAGRAGNAARADLPQPDLAQPSLGFAVVPSEGSEGNGSSDALRELDVVLLVRGGGSLEDLMSFNSEAVVRAIAACPLPVVSGVGHEVDVTLADLVADARAATPSAAAAAVLPDRRALALQLRRDTDRLRIAIESRVKQARGDWRREHDALRVLAPSARLAAQRVQLAAAVRALRASARAASERPRARLARLAAQLDSLSPLAVLGRGYALVRRSSDGSIIRHSHQVDPGDRLSIRVAKARIQASVESVERVESD